MNATADCPRPSSSPGESESWGVVPAESAFFMSPTPSTEIQRTPETFQGMTGSSAVSDLSCYGNLACRTNVGQSPGVASINPDNSGVYDDKAVPLRNTWTDVTLSDESANLRLPKSGPLLERPDLVTQNEGVGAVPAPLSPSTAFIFPITEQQAFVTEQVTEINSPRLSISRPAFPRKWVNSEDWERHKFQIVRLYFYEKKTLVQVRTIMEEKHGFRAT